MQQKVLTFEEATDLVKANLARIIKITLILIGHRGWAGLMRGVAVQDEGLGENQLLVALRLHLPCFL